MTKLMYHKSVNLPSAIESRQVRKILLSCVKPTPESIFGDVPDLNITKAILDAKKLKKWKKTEAFKPPLTSLGELQITTTK